MLNIIKLLRAGGNQKIFGRTLLDLKDSTGFYSRLYTGINEMDDETFDSFCETLNKQNFKDCVDVVLWLEA